MKIWSFIIALLFFAACEALPTSPDRIPDTPYRAVTEVGKMLEGCASVGHIYADSSYVITPGLEETDVHLQTMEGKVEHVYFLKVSLGQKGLGVEVGLPYDKDFNGLFLKQTPSQMAEYADREERRVMAAVNGDFWDTSTEEIRGPIHRDGRILKDTFIYSSSLSDQAISFFGIDSEGKPVIRDSAEYRAMQQRLIHCTGSGVIVLREGDIPGDFSAYSSNRHPRTCVGYSADGKTLWFFVCDGRTALWSDGMLYWEMGEIMKSIGCSWATNLDGGGSSQLVVRKESNGGTSWQLRNRASDGSERPVVNTWMISADCI